MKCNRLSLWRSQGIFPLCLLHSRFALSNSFGPFFHLILLSPSLNSSVPCPPFLLCHPMLFSPTMELGCIHWHVCTLHVHLHTLYVYHRPSLSLQLILSFDSPVIDQRKAIPVRLILWECCLWIRVVWRVFSFSWRKQMSSVSFKQHHFIYLNCVVWRIIYTPVFVCLFFWFCLLWYSLYFLLMYNLKNVCATLCGWWDVKI